MPRKELTSFAVTFIALVQICVHGKTKRELLAPSVLNVTLKDEIFHALAIVAV
jgi:hypothetical protein